ncbi:MAG: hypothetical protein JHC93_04130 [Parachlamydiales bacterium]|nr:hypothetical protein [Parachlamydiales bacterium]
MNIPSFEFLNIAPLYGTQSDPIRQRLYDEMIRAMLMRIIPLETNVEFNRYLSSVKRFFQNLPYITWSEFNEVPINLSFFLLCPYRPNAFKFFFEMVSRWLVPGKRLNVVVFFAADFRLPQIHEENIYTLCEIEVKIESARDLDIVQKNTPIIATEIRLGAQSVYHAIRILEVKGLSMDEKTAMIQENIAAIVKRRPDEFDYDIFSEMQHFLVSCNESFKAAREYQHMSRIICFHYLFRKALKEALEHFPERRHLSIKFIKTRLHCTSGIKTVWGIVVGLNLFGDSEFFEQRHLIRAIQTFVPEATKVLNSLFINRLRTDLTRLFYCEIEKSDGSNFTQEEIQILRQELPQDLKNYIERRVHPIFMPRNEEEIMRHIVTLSNQLKFVRDIPQVILIFDEQTENKLCFTVVLLRLLRQDSKPIHEHFIDGNTFLEYGHDRVKVVGSLRKKHPKEANVFQVKLEKGRFLREDHSVDLYKARQVIMLELGRIIGEIRDYNGGMISKQNETYDALRELLGDVAIHNALLLENFFYSLFPVLMRTLLEPHLLKIFFLLLLDTLEDGYNEDEGYSFRFQEDDGTVFLIIVADDSSFKDSICYIIDQLKIPSLQYTSMTLKISQVTCWGFLYRCEAKEKRLNFCLAIEKALHAWKSYTQNKFFISRF